METKKKACSKYDDWRQAYDNLTIDLGISIRDIKVGVF